MFHTVAETAWEFIKELVSFYVSRVFTLVVEEGLIYILVDEASPVGDGHKDVHISAGDIPQLLYKQEVYIQKDKGKTVRDMYKCECLSKFYRKTWTQLLPNI